MESCELNYVMRDAKMTRAKEWSWNTYIGEILKEGLPRDRNSIDINWFAAVPLSNCEHRSLFQHLWPSFREITGPPPTIRLKRLRDTSEDETAIAFIRC